MTKALFSFGTLRQADVQRGIFSRPVPGSPDAIVGYRVGLVRITDPAAIAASGSDLHPALIITNDPSDVVSGDILDLDEEELMAVHRYEHVSFRPIEVRTMSGRAELAYAPKPELTLED